MIRELQNIIDKQVINDRIIESSEWLPVKVGKPKHGIERIVTYYEDLSICFDVMHNEDGSNFQYKYHESGAVLVVDGSCEINMTPTNGDHEEGETTSFILRPGSIYDIRKTGFVYRIKPLTRYVLSIMILDNYVTPKKENTTDTIRKEEILDMFRKQWPISL